MKTYRLLLIAAALIGSAALLSAGPDSRFYNRPANPTKAPAAVVTAAPATNVAVASCATCACCKKAS